MTLPATSELTVRDGRVLRYCRYGPADGFPVLSHGGSPSSRWKRPGQIDAMEQSGLRFLVYDRPGYGGSTRRPGRRVADAVEDAVSLADAQGWSRFAVFGGSGGGPHALACAALLSHIPAAQGHTYTGGHLPGPDVYGEIYDWLHPGA